MNDGSLKSAQYKGVLLNTHGFTLKEVEHLCQVLNEKFALKAHPRKQSHQYKNQCWAQPLKIYYQISISGNSYEFTSAASKLTLFLFLVCVISFLFLGNASAFGNWLRRRPRRSRGGRFTLFAFGNEPGAASPAVAKPILRRSSKD